MDDKTEPNTVNQQLPRQKISSRAVVVALGGFIAAEAAAGGITWQMGARALSNFVLIFASLFTIIGNHAPHFPTPTNTTLAHRLLTRTVPPPYSAMFGFNARHTHFIPDETTLGVSNVAGLKLDWKMPTSSGIRSSPLVSNGIVYITSSDNTLFAFDATTGANLWQVSTGAYAGPGSFIFSSPAILNNVLYIGSNDHHVYAFNAVSGGKPLWKAPTGGPIYSSPAVVNKILYVGSTDHSIYAFNTNTGSLLWKAPTGGAIYSSPAVVNNVLYVGSDDSRLYAFNASTGRVLWTGIAQDHIDSSPTVVDGMVYVGVADGHIYAFDATGCQEQITCQPIWTTSTGSFINSSPAVVNGILYIGSHDNTLYAFDTNRCLNSPPNSNCPSLWTWSAPATTAQPFESSPTVANGVVYIGSWDGKLYAFDAKKGTQLWSFATAGQIVSSPTVLNGMVFAGSTDQHLYAFRSLPLPCLHINPGMLTFTGTQGQSDPAEQTLTMTNCGSIGLWSASTANGFSWLVFNPARGALNVGASQSVTLSVSIFGLSVGSYSDMITFTLSNGVETSQQAVKVSLSVRPPSPP